MRGRLHRTRRRSKDDPAKAAAKAPFRSTHRIGEDRRTEASRRVSPKPIVEALRSPGRVTFVIKGKRVEVEAGVPRDE